MNLDFSNKTILVAGGTGGLGRAVSLAFLREGATVAVTFRHKEEFVPLTGAAAAGSERLAGFDADVTDARATADLVSEILSQFNRLDALVNCVGGYAGGTPLWQLEPEVFNRQLDLNLRATYALAKAAAPAMIVQKGGSIVNIASKAAWDHAAGASAYTASKAAAVALIDSLAADLLGTGVRVNSVLPSIIDTEANRRAIPNADFSRWPKADDVASVILFLASDASRVIHGASIPVFGNA
jgi:NAD(P)-dependent dehydrogenase (short-subunit alcohol dehydrogenase family)